MLKKKFGTDVEHFAFKTLYLGSFRYFFYNFRDVLLFVDINDRRGEISQCDLEEGLASSGRIDTTTLSDEEAGRTAAVVPATVLGTGGRRFLRSNWTWIR